MFRLQMARESVDPTAPSLDLERDPDGALDRDLESCLAESASMYVGGASPASLSCPLTSLSYTILRSNKVSPSSCLAGDTSDARRSLGAAATKAATAGMTDVDLGVEPEGTAPPAALPIRESLPTCRLP